MNLTFVFDGYLADEVQPLLFVFEGYLIVVTPPTPTPSRAISIQQEEPGSGSKRMELEKRKREKLIEEENEIILTVIKVFLEVN